MTRERIRRWNLDTSQLNVRPVVESGEAPRNILSCFLMMRKRLVSTAFVRFAGVERRMPSRTLKVRKVHEFKILSADS